MRITLSLIFFLSGVSALIFETLWFRLVGLSLGNSIWSASLVLGAFMGGLALGNALTARLGNRISRPILLYVGLELVIGLVGASLVFALPEFPKLLGPMLGGLASIPWLLNLVRLTTAFAVLVIPATAMGATLPILVHALTRVEPNFGASLGRLYGWNTLGAMLGAIASEALLIKWLGIVGSGLFALVLNFAAALIALRLSRSFEADIAPDNALVTSPNLSARGYRYLGVAFLSGAIMLAFEVVGFRFLLLSHDGTSLIFAVMLAVVLAGIALGGLVAARFYSLSDQAHVWLRTTTALSGAMVVLTYAGFNVFTAQQIQQNTTTLEFFGFAAFLMLPVALLSGVTFTMVGRAVKDELGTSVRTTGVTTFCNTLGAMLGSLAGGFILLPVVGMENSFFLLAAAYGVTTLIVPDAERVYNRLTMLARPAAIVTLAACLVLFPFGLMQQAYFGILSTKLRDHELVETRESLTATIQYYRNVRHGEPLYYRLATNGYSMSSTTTFARRYMKLYVYLPVALNPEMREALLISFGVGSTAKALTDTAGLQHIDVVDISRDILDMSTLVYDDYENPLHDPRVRVHVEDGRFFLNTTPRLYDLITSEPPPPKISGIVNLYSQEYFELIRSRLREGGYTTYWLPAQELEPLDTLAITRAFCNAFPDCSLWSGAGLNWMLMGSNHAVAGASIAEFSAQWRDPEANNELRALGFETPAQMGSLFMADAEMLVTLTAGIPPVTDNYPLRISSRLPYRQDREPLYDRMMNEDTRLERFRTSHYIDTFWPDGLKAESETYFQYERIIKDYFTAGRYSQPTERLRWDVIDELLTSTPLETLPLWLLGTNVAMQDIAQQRLQTGAYDAEFEGELALGSLARRDYPTALEQLNRYVVGQDRISMPIYSVYLYTLARNDRMDDVRAFVGRISPLGESPDAMAPFLDWFARRFELYAMESGDPPSRMDDAIERRQYHQSQQRR